MVGKRKHLVDYTGREYGFLKVLREGPRTKSDARQWYCECVCGNVVLRAQSKLQPDRVSSCGKCGRSGSYSHGMTGIPEHNVWNAMKYRCNNPRTKAYPNYGGRGITVCDRWMESFANFMEDMGPRPSPTHTIERIDNDGNYEPSNCKWIPKGEQTANRRIVRVVTYNGSKIRLYDLAKLHGIHVNTLRQRIVVMGMSAEDAVSVPISSMRGGPRKVTASDVLEIRRLRGTVSQQDIADMFGITQSAVWAIQQRKCWRHV